MRFNFFINLLFVFVYSHVDAGSWIERKAEGWAWYENKEKERLEEKLKKESAESNDKVYTEKLTSLKKDLEEAKAKAVLEPTEENILIYQTMQKEWTDNASKFTKLWVLNLINNPEIDSRLEYPVTQYGINAIKEVDEMEKRELIQRLSNKYLIFYFYKGSERASQVFSLILKSFADKYRYTFFGILGDGIPIDGFKSLPDNGISSSFSVKAYPSAYFVDIETGDGIPISNGLNSIDQIENNIWMLFSGKR